MSAPMNEKVKILKLKRESGYFYFVDKDGDISRYKLSQRAISQKLLPPQEGGRKVQSHGHLSTCTNLTRAELNSLFKSGLITETTRDFYLNRMERFNA